MAYRHPDRFAAIIPICAWAQNTDWVRTLKDLPIWVFHGDKDTLVPLKESENMIKALEAKGNHAGMTVLSGRDHYISDVYEKSEIYEWLLEHRRRH